MAKKNLPSEPELVDSDEVAVDLVSSIAPKVAEIVRYQSEAQVAIQSKRLEVEAEMGKRQLDSYDKAQALKADERIRVHRTTRLGLGVILVVLMISGAYMFSSSDPEVFKTIVFTLIGAISGWGARGALEKPKKADDE